MSSSAMAQINVRIDRELKEKGDAELARLGISPSEAVRSLWERLSAGGREARRACISLVSTVSKQDGAQAVSPRLAALEKYEAKRTDFLSMLGGAGINPSSLRPLTEEELHEARYKEFVESFGE